MKPSIVVVGSCMTDLISYTEVLPKPGETIHGNTFAIGFGGKGANQCVAAARLGANTAMVACVGDDSFGKNYISHFESTKINIDHVKVIKGISTGVATIVVDGKGENCIIIVGGANQKMSEGSVLEVENLIRECLVVICQGEINESATKQALTLARKHKVLTLMNAAPAHPNMDEEIYSLSDIFCVNESEAEILTGFRVKTVKDAEVASKFLKEKGCKEVILTMGAEGVLYYGDTFVHISAPQVPSVVDTTGAGDAFVGALAYFLACEPQLHRTKMIERACKIASISVQFKGTQTSFPYKNDVLHILNL